MRLRFSGHWWRSKNEAVSDFVLWEPKHGKGSVGGQGRTGRHRVPQRLPAGSDGQGWLEKESLGVDWGRSSSISRDGELWLQHGQQEWEAGLRFFQQILFIRWFHNETELSIFTQAVLWFMNWFICSFWHWLSKDICDFNHGKPNKMCIL